MKPKCMPFFKEAESQPTRKISYDRHQTYSSFEAFLKKQDDFLSYEENDIPSFGVCTNWKQSKVATHNQQNDLMLTSKNSTMDEPRSQPTLPRDSDKKSFGSTLSLDRSQMIMELGEIDDRRMVNIDRINDKIKCILHTLESQEKVTTNFQRNVKTQHDYEDRSQCHDVDTENNRYSMKIRRTGKENQNYCTSKGLAEFSNNTQKREPLKEKKSYMQSSSSHNKTCLGSTQHLSANAPLSNSKSNYYDQKPSSKRYSLNQNPFKARRTTIGNSLENQGLRDNPKIRNIDNEIYRIQEKIQQFEKVKKEMNITSSSGSYHKLKVNFASSLPYERDILPEKHAGHLSSKQPYSIKKRLKINDYQRARLKTEPVEQLDSREEEEVHIPKVLKFFKGKKDKALKTQHLRESIENYRESSIIENPRVHIAKLMAAYQRQIQLDQQLRNSKKWLQYLPSAYKWIDLAEALRSYGFQMNENQMKESFTLFEEENNPFYSTRNTNQSLEKLIENFCQAEQHWHNNIRHQQQLRQLEQEGLNAELVDIGRKGFITIDDLGRFINIETNSYHRNRDVYLIYSRLLGNENVLSFEQMMRVLVKNDI